MISASRPLASIFVFLSVFLASCPAHPAGQDLVPTIPVPLPAGKGAVSWAQSPEERKRDGSKVGLSSFREVDQDGRLVRDGVPVNWKEYKGASFILVPAGTYELQASCTTAYRLQLLNAVLRVEDGKRYRVRCIGRTPRSVKLLVEHF